MCSHSNAQELILLWLSMVISNLGHCFMGCFLSCFNLLNWAGLNWQFQFCFAESGCETKSRGKKLSHFLFSFGGRFWRSKKWVSWLWAVIFQCKHGGNNNTNILIWLKMVNKEPLCLCMWWSCWYSFNSRRLIEVKSILSFLVAGILLADEVDLRPAGSSAACSYRGMSGPKWIQPIRFFCLSLLLSRVS